MKINLQVINNKLVFNSVLFCSEFVLISNQGIIATFYPIYFKRISNGSTNALYESNSNIPYVPHHKYRFGILTELDDYGLLDSTTQYSVTYDYLYNGHTLPSIVTPASLLNTDVVHYSPYNEYQFAEYNYTYFYVSSRQQIGSIIPISQRPYIYICDETFSYNLENLPNGTYHIIGYIQDDFKEKYTDVVSNSITINDYNRDFTIKFYDNSAENSRIDKTNYLGGELSLTGSLRTQCSIVTPIITVEVDEETDIKKYNYLYIKLFHRYYYIDDIISIRSHLWEIRCQCDTLMSFKEQIYNLDVFALRNEFNYDLRLIDEKLPAYGMRYNSVYNLGSFDYFPTGYAYTITLVTKEGYDTESDLAYKNGFNGNTITTRTYICSKNAVNLILQAITNPEFNFKGMFLDEPHQAVQSIKVFPFNIINKISYTETKHTTNPKTYTLDFVGNAIEILASDLEPNFQSIYEIASGNLSNVAVIEHNLTIPDKIFDTLTYLNTNAYTSYKLYIPLYGIIDIDSTYLFNYRSINVKYNIDIVTGDCTIFIDCGIRYVVTCNVGIDIPITGSNANSKARNLTLGAIKAVGAVAGLGAVTSLVPSGGKSTETTTKFNYNKSGAISSLKRTQTEEPATSERKFDFSKTSNFISKTTIDVMSSLVSSNCGGNVKGDFTCYKGDVLNFVLYLERVNYYVPQGYNHLVGRPSTYAGKLSGLKGYTEIAGVHIEGVSIATMDEKFDIESKLKQGVIMPN